MKKERRACEVSEGDCLAPAGFGNSAGWADGEGSARGTCYACGDPVCGNCSTLTRRYVKGKRVRMCATCMAYILSD